MGRNRTRASPRRGQTDALRPHAWKTPDLASSSAARTAANADLATVSRLGKLREARKDKTVKPLERTAWQAEHKRTKADLEALDPKKKDAKPLMEVVSLTPQTSPDARMQKQLNRWKEILASDIWVDETTRVLGDMKKTP